MCVYHFYNFCLRGKTLKTTLFEPDMYSGKHYAGPMCTRARGRRFNWQLSSTPEKWVGKSCSWYIVRISHTAMQCVKTWQFWQSKLRKIVPDVPARFHTLWKNGEIVEDKTGFCRFHSMNMSSLCDWAVFNIHRTCRFCQIIDDSVQHQITMVYQFALAYCTEILRWGYKKAV